MTNLSTPVERGCGTRVEGGIYFDMGLGTGENAMPVEWFLCDQPEVVAEEITVQNRGVTLIERDGVWHVIDRIGLEHYPNVADFIEEVRRFGLSRRLPVTLDFSKLTPESRILLVHDRAWADNIMEYDWWTCPKKHTTKSIEHERLVTKSGAFVPPVKYTETPDHFCCAGLWWQDVEGGEPVVVDGVADAYALARYNELVDRQDNSRHRYGAVVDVANTPQWDTQPPFEALAPRLIVRKCPAFSYFARSRPALTMIGEPLEPQYRPAFFASFPVGALTVVKGHGSDASLYAAKQSSIEVVEVQQ